MEIRLWMSPLVQKKVHIILKLFIHYDTCTCSYQKNIAHYGWSQCALMQLSNI